MRIIFLFLMCMGLYTPAHAEDQITTIRVTDSTSFYIDTALYYKTNNNYRSAIFYLTKAIEKASLEKSDTKAAKAYVLLGEIYLELKKYHDAIQVYQRGSEIYRRYPPGPEIAYCFQQIGISHAKRNEYDLAETNFRKAISIYESLKLNDAAVLIELQKAKLFFDKNEISRASETLSRIDATILNSKENSSILSEYYLTHGMIENDKLRHNLAITYFKKAIQHLKKNSSHELQSKIYYELSKAYQLIDQPLEAYKNLQYHVQFKDSIETNNRSKLGNQDLMSFQDSERIKHIEELNKQVKERDKTYKLSQLLTFLSITLITILSLFSYVLYKNNRIRTKANEMLVQKNKELQIARDKAEKATKIRSEFLSTVSHELRTPLNAINGITHLLIQENPKKSQLQYLQSLKFSGDYLLNFINDILEINRVESEHIEVEHTLFNFQKLIKDIQNSLQELANDNRNNLDIVFGPKVPVYVSGDATKLSQILLNLFNNALKFTHDGQVKVLIDNEYTSEDTCLISIQIMDNGIGIPENKQATIFDSFTQGSVEINRKYGGTGLGLAIVRKLVEILKGSIRLESTEGIGTTFFIQIPFVVAQEKTTEDHSITNSDYNDELFIRKKILIVEDNKINQMITKKMVEAKGVETIIIDNGEEAIEEVRSQNFDLILMDVHLPGINGTIATQEIRKFNKKVPIIALTAISLNENRDDLMSFGMDDVVTKPFNPETFYKAMATLLEKEQ